MATPIHRYPRNRTGTDYVVGDVHGERYALEHELDRIHFDDRRDRLFSVGDLIDRGPDSSAMLEWLDYPWFHPVMGNHEEMALLSENDWEQLLWWISINGGSWWLNESVARRQRFADKFRQLPLAIEVETGHGTVGIVHGDVPPSMSWRAFVEALRAGDADACHYCLWGRQRAEGAVRHGVDDVYRVFTGHTPLGEPARVGNLYMIDTGACFGGRLTIVSLTGSIPIPSRRKPALADAR